MKKTRILAVLIALVMLAGILSACSDNNQTSTPPASGGGERPALVGKDIENDPIKIASISISTAGIVNRIYDMAFRDQGYRFPNVRVDRRDAEYNPNRQIELIDEAITQGYDAILLECMDPFALNDAVERAENAGIPVISLNAARPFTTHTLHMAGADHSTGWWSGQLMDEMTRGTANRTAIVLDCPPSFKPGALMGTGFEDYVEQMTDIKLIEQFGVENWSAENARIAMDGFLAKYPNRGDITMVYCANDDIANGAVLAIEAAGRTGDIVVWGFQVQAIGFQNIRDGKLAGSMFCDTYVQYSTAFYMALYYIASGVNSRSAGYTETPIVEQPMLPVTQASVEEVAAVSRWFSN